MLRLQQYLPTPNGVQANGTGSLNLPLGATYYSLKMEMSDGSTNMTVENMVARVRNIRLKINGVQVRQYTSLQELINLNKMHGIETLAGTTSAPKTKGAVVFYFAEPQRRTPTGEDVFAWQMYSQLGVQSFNLEFDITSNASSSFNVQISRDYAQFPASALPKALPNMVFHSSQLLPNDNAGKPTTSTLQKVAYTRIHAFAPKGTVDGVPTQVLAGAQVKVNNLVIREFRDYAEYESYMFENGLNTIEDWLTIPFDETNRYDEILDVRSANSFEVQYTTKCANSITLITEELKSLS